MPSIYKLKPAFQNMLRPFVRTLFNLGVTANQVTIFAALMSVTYGIFLYIAQDPAMLLLFLPLVMFVRMALNAIDGMLAREYGQESKTGAILNELCDVIADTFLYFPFAALNMLNTLWVMLFIFLSILTEMTGILGVSIGGTRRYDGPMGKSDRAFLFGGLGLYLGSGFLPGLYPYMDWVLMVGLVLLCMIIYNRANGALQEAK